jgi:hypothetical protein
MRGLTQLNHLFVIMLLEIKMAFYLDKARPRMDLESLHAELNQDLVKILDNLTLVKI